MIWPKKETFPFFFFCCNEGTFLNIFKNINICSEHMVRWRCLSIALPTDTLICIQNETNRCSFPALDPERKKAWIQWWPLAFSGLFMAPAKPWEAAFPDRQADWLVKASVKQQFFLHISHLTVPHEANTLSLAAPSCFSSSGLRGKA